MKFYKYLYTSDDIKNIDKIKLKLNEHRGMPGYFLIALSASDGQLDIFNASYLKFKYYRTNPPVVVGLSKTYDEAVDIIIKIIEESIKKCGNCNIKEYLIRRAKTFDFTKEE